jgi:nitrogen regulatory protein PII-like uncharacterized protein
MPNTAKRTTPVKRSVSAATAAAVLFAQMPLALIGGLVGPTPSRAQMAASVGITSSSNIMSRTEYEACQAKDETAFRGAMEELTYKGLRTGLAGIDYNGVVRDEWRKLDFDQVLDKQVDIAVNEVKDETSWTNLIKSIGSAEQANALATAVAERTYKSQAVTKSFEDLATSVGRALGKRIEMATSDTAEPAMQCMQLFLGQRYGNTVARMFSREAGKEYQIDPSKNSADVSTGSVLATGAGGLTGAVILIVRRQITNMAARIGSRIVGAVAARVVGVVAGGVGVILIAKDVWDFRHGVMPIIASEMKSKDTKIKVQEELARAIQEQISDNLREISARTADRILEVWQQFKAAHAKVLDLSEKNADFKRFLDQQRPEALARLDEVVSLILPKEGEAGVLTRLANGTLNDAINRMPVAGLDIARDTGSIDTALAWWALAGDDMSRIIDADLHKLTTPQSLTKATLTRLMSLGDKVALSRLAALPTEQRQVLFELDTSALRKLGHALERQELASLSGYLTGLEKGASQRILSAVAQTPSKMQILARPSVRQAILNSRDQSTAVGMMLKSDGVPDPFAAIEHARYVMDGKVSPTLLWEKNPWFVAVVGFFSLSLLLMMRRMLFGRRAKVIVQKVEVPAAAAAASGPEAKRASNAPPIRTKR